MSISFQYEAILREGLKIDPYDPNAKFGDLQLSVNGISFTGKGVKFPTGVEYDSEGFNLEIPLSKIKKVYKSKFKILHLIKIF